jgi:hypothetical protein
MADRTGDFDNQWTFRELSGTSPQDQIGSQHFDAEGGNPPLKDGISYSYDGDDDTSLLDTNVSDDFFDVSGSADWAMFLAIRNQVNFDSFAHVLHANDLNGWTLRYVSTGSQGYLFKTRDGGVSYNLSSGSGYGAGVTPNSDTLTIIGISYDFSAFDLRGRIRDTEGRDILMSASTQGGGAQMLAKGLRIANDSQGGTSNFSEFEILELAIIRGEFLSQADIDDTVLAMYQNQYSRFRVSNSSKSLLLFG